MMLSVIVPTYNEAENVMPLVTGLHAALRTGYEIIIVDDNSPDGTASKVEQLAKQFPGLRLVRRSGKQGLTSAVVAGASAARGEQILVMDADLSHPSEIVPAMAAALKGCDLVVGSRLMKGGSVETWPLHRKAISSGAELLARIFIGTKISDPMSGFFAVRKEVFMKTRFRSRGYKLLLNILADNPRITIIEIPYTFRDRNAGKTKLGTLEMLTYLIDLLRIRMG